MARPKDPTKAAVEAIQDVLRDARATVNAPSVEGSARALLAQDARHQRELAELERRTLKRLGLS